MWIVLAVTNSYSAYVHRVGNPGESPVVSVHLYGSRLEDIDGCDYDPSRDYVCDRMEN